MNSNTEHFILIIKSIIFCRNKEMNKIVCWARSPGDHALNLEQFPIQNFNENRQNFDKVM